MRQEEIHERAVILWRKKMQSGLDSLSKLVDDLEARVKTLEAKRGPGRPPKTREEGQA